MRGRELAERSATTTDAKGKATLKPVHPGWVAVSGHRRGLRARQRLHARSARAGAIGQLTITLHKGYAVSGRVVDEAGKPIAKVQVSRPARGGPATAATRTRRTRRRRRRRRAPASRSPTTRASSRSRRSPPARTRSRRSTASTRRRRSAPVTGRSITPVTGVEITMKAGGTLAGTVVDDRRQAGAVRDRPRRRRRAQMWMVAARQATSDAEGAFELRGLARDKLQARAESDQRREQDRRRRSDRAGDRSGTSSSCSTSRARSPASSSTTRARRSPRSQVNAFPDIWAGESREASRSPGMSSATTDGAGEFTIHGLPDGALQAVGVAHGRRPLRLGPARHAAKTGDKNVKITLAAPGVLKGTIAIEGASAPPRSPACSSACTRRRRRSDGAFELKDVAPGTLRRHVPRPRVRGARSSATSRSSPARRPTSAR